MTNMIERSILMTLGAAMLTKEMAESVVGGLEKKGEETTALGREAVDEALAKAKNETQSLVGRFDKTIQRNLRELGLAQNSDIEELKLKMAQLEHRLTLLEGSETEAAVRKQGAEQEAVAMTEEGEEGVIGEAVSKGPDAASEPKGK